MQFVFGKNASCGWKDTLFNMRSETKFKYDKRKIDYMIVTIKDAIKLEKTLLEIEERYKFVLDFNDVVTLNKLIKEIGEITELFFNLQIEYGEKYQDSKLLSEYKDKLSNNKFELNVKKYINFLTLVELKTKKDNTN